MLFLKRTQHEFPIERRISMRAVGLIVIFLLLTGVVFAEDKGEAVKVYKATVAADGVQRIEIVGGDYFYDPNYIVVKKGVPVELIIRKNPGIVPHNIVIASPDAGMEIRDSLDTEKRTIQFTPSKTGTYPFYCDKKFLFFKNHREKGMEGVIEVTD